MNLCVVNLKKSRHCSYILGPNLRRPIVVNKSHTKTRKLSYRKDDRAMRPIYGCPENFRESLSTATAVPKLLMGSCSDGPCECTLNIVALPIPEIIGGTQKMGSPLIRPRSLFSKIFHELVFGWTL